MGILLTSIKKIFQYLIGTRILLMSVLFCWTAKNWFALTVCDQRQLAFFFLAFQDILPSSSLHAVQN